MKEFIESIGYVMTIIGGCIGAFIAMALVLVGLILNGISECVCVAAEWIVSKISGFVDNHTKHYDEEIVDAEIIEVK